MLPLREESIINQIEENTNFEYNIGDGDAIGGYIEGLEHPIYIDPSEEDYFVSDMNTPVVLPDWENEESVKAYFAGMQEQKFATIEEVIEELNRIEAKHK